MTPPRQSLGLDVPTTFSTLFRECLGDAPERVIEMVGSCGGGHAGTSHGRNSKSGMLG